MKVSVYTDGACTHNGQRDAKASWAYYIPEHKALSGSGRVPDDQPQTNNRGELLAILRAIEKIAESFDASEVELYIYTDSEYSKNCITTWMPGWIKRNWMTASGTPVLNKDLIQSISGRLIMFQSYCITHVRAHTGGDDEFSRNNHIVDRMAVEALSPVQSEPAPKPVQLRGIEGCPLQMMGPPVSEKSLAAWCRSNMDKLDEDAVNAALLKALEKTFKKNGCLMEKQKLHRTSQYRLISSTQIGIVLIRKE